MNANIPFTWRDPAVSVLHHLDQQPTAPTDAASAKSMKRGNLRSRLDRIAQAAKQHSAIDLPYALTLADLEATPSEVLESYRAAWRSGKRCLSWSDESDAIEAILAGEP
ncbi:MAG: hypothetical protein RhofKO_10640 [Rhodothermales bacterium]